MKNKKKNNKWIYLNRYFSVEYDSVVLCTWINSVQTNKLRRSKWKFLDFIVANYSLEFLLIFNRQLLLIAVILFLNMYILCEFHVPSIAFL